jgi:hypothetical protein
MLYIAADSSVGGLVDVRAVNKHLVERFRGSRQKFKLWDYLRRRRHVAAAALLKTGACLSGWSAKPRRGPAVRLRPNCAKAGATWPKDRWWPRARLRQRRRSPARSGAALFGSRAASLRRRADSAGDHDGGLPRIALRPALGTGMQVVPLTDDARSAFISPAGL